MLHWYTCEDWKVLQSYFKHSKKCCTYIGTPPGYNIILICAAFKMECRTLVIFEPCLCKVIPQQLANLFSWVYLVWLKLLLAFPSRPLSISILEYIPHMGHSQELSNWVHLILSLGLSQNPPFQNQSEPIFWQCRPCRRQTVLEFVFRPHSVLRSIYRFWLLQQ